MAQASRNVKYKARIKDKKQAKYCEMVRKSQISFSILIL